MKIFYNGREISEDYAKSLEDSGEASFHNQIPSSADGEVQIVMASGPGNNWLEKQPPEVFLRHVFGHTCTWKEMAEKFSETNAEMIPVASALRSLNHWINATIASGRKP